MDPSTFELLNPVPGPGVREETTMSYKVNGSAEMTDTSLVRTHGVIGRRAEPAIEHGPGIVGDSGERSDAHPV